MNNEENFIDPVFSTSRKTIKTTKTSIKKRKKEGLVGFRPDSEIHLVDS
jgi:hypothetical protein